MSVLSVAGGYWFELPDVTITKWIWAIIGPVVFLGVGALVFVTICFLDACHRLAQGDILVLETRSPTSGQDCQAVTHVKGLDGDVGDAFRVFRLVDGMEVEAGLATVIHVQRDRTLQLALTNVSKELLGDILARKKNTLRSLFFKVRGDVQHGVQP